MPEKFLMKIWNRLRNNMEIKWAVGSTFIVGLIAHMYKFTNHIPNWDSLMDYYYPTHNMIFQGRQFQFLPAAFRAFKDIPWIIGLLSLLYLSMIVLLMVKLFEIHGRLPIAMISALVVVSPPVTSTLGYMFTADCYFFAGLLAVLAVYVSKEFRYGWLPGAVLLGMGIGIYQAYLSLAMVLILFLLVRDIILAGEEKFGRALYQQYLKYLGMGVLSLLFYKVSLEIMCRVERIELVNHHGLGSIHFPSLSEFLQAIKQSIIDTIYYYVGSLSKLNLYGISSLVSLLILGIFLVMLVYKKKVYKYGSHLFLAAVSLLLIPCACHCFYFVTNEVEYYALMQFPLVLSFGFLFWEYEQVDTKHAIGQWGVVLSTVILIYVLIVSANVAYRVQTLSYEKTYAMMDRVVARMEELPNYQDAEKLAVIGNLPGTDIYAYGTAPALAGYADSYLVSHQKHVVSMLDEYYGVKLEGVSDEIKEELMSLQEVGDMPVWPNNGSVTQVNDIIVVRFSEEMMQLDQK